MYESCLQCKYEKKILSNRKTKEEAMINIVQNYKDTIQYNGVAYVMPLTC